jgi:hypothetical protein
MSVDWLLVARDGGILALGACALIGALLKFNPRLLLRHFPEDLQRAVPPKTPAESVTRSSAASPCSCGPWPS